MANVRKFKSVQVGHLVAHYERRRGADGELVRYGNEKINPSLSHLNYNLAPERGSQAGFIRKRCGEVHCQKREDVKVMCSWVVTVPKDFLQEHPERLREFFQQSYTFLERRYGQDNVISAYVHMDEVTPHMHFAFVPVTEDKRRGGFKVSAKEVLTRQDLASFHQDLSVYLQASMGLEVHVMNEATKDGNRDVAELKREARLKEIAELDENALKLRDEVWLLERHLDRLNARIEALSANMTGYEQMSGMLFSINPSQTLTGAVRGISVDEVEELKQFGLEALALRSENEKLKHELAIVRGYDLSPKERNKMEREISDLKNELKIAKKHIRNYKAALGKLPKEVQDELLGISSRQGMSRQYVNKSRRRVDREHDGPRL